METRVCALCKETKPIEMFDWKNKETGARQYRCKPCRSTNPGFVRERRVYFCLDCGVEITRKGLRCKTCAWDDRKSNSRQKKSISSKGYVVIGGHQSHSNSRGNGQIFEHTLVMSAYKDRPLRDDEIVHHKNGDRTDNRIENLELCSNKKQPPGQRIEDLVFWARDLIRLYGEEYPE